MILNDLKSLCIKLSMEHPTTCDSRTYLNYIRQYIEFAVYLGTNGSICEGSGYCQLIGHSNWIRVVWVSI